LPFRRFSAIIADFAQVRSYRPPQKNGLKRLLEGRFFSALPGLFAHCNSIDKFHNIFGWLLIDAMRHSL
jgi:hypothetical protein